MSLVTGRALILARLWNLVEPKMDVFSTFSVKKKKKKKEMCLVAGKPLAVSL